MKELGERVTALQVIEQVLEGHAGSAEDGCSSENFGIFHDYVAGGCHRYSSQAGGVLRDVFADRLEPGLPFANFGLTRIDARR